MRITPLISLCLIFSAVSPVSAQLFWNPSQSDPYAPVGGNGSWNSDDVWWDGSSNVSIGQDPGSRVVFEGSGTVGGGTFQPQGLDFQNLTGNYNIDFGIELRLSGTHAVHVTGGSFDVTLPSLGYTAGTGANRSVRNDGTGTLTLASVLRRFGGGTTNLAFHGDGNFALNGAGAMGGTLIKNGAGLLTIGGSMNSFTNGMVLNAGAMRMDNTGTSLTWNDGRLVFDLDESDFSSNLIDLSGDFNKGTGADFEFDFGGFNASTQGTYTLLNFASTNFDAMDFSATGITFGAGLSGAFNLTGSELQFSVIPEPSTYALIFGVLCFGYIAYRRRRD